MPKVRILQEKRDRLQALLDEIIAGKFQHFDPDDDGRLRRKTIDESRASLERRITELNHQIAEASSDG